MTPPDTTPAAAPYRADIDGLRAVAVVLVLAFHFKLLPGMGEAGFIGVDIFFVISGYLITGLLLRAIERAPFSLAMFYVHRARRLAPALLATLLACLVYAWWRLLPNDFAELIRQLVATQWYGANFYYWQHIGYFGLGVDRAALLHTWSLAVEEQFYLLYPLALMAVHRWARAWLLPILLLGLVVSFGLNVLLVHAKPNAVFYLLPARAWQLLAGALLSLAPGGPWQHGKSADTLGLLGLLAIGAALWLHHPGIGVPGWFGILPVAGAAALLYACGGGQGWVGRTLSASPVVYVGRISYPAYLVHWPLHVFAGLELGSSYTLGAHWAMFLISLLLASAIYHWVEQPIRQARWLRGNRQLLLAYAASLAATLPLLMASQHTGGLPSRYPAHVVQLDNAANDRPPPLTECAYSPNRTVNLEPVCQLGVGGSQRATWLIYGDSHAWAAHGVFDEWLRRRGETGYFYFRHGCPPVVATHVIGDRGACAAFNDTALAFLANAPEIKNVLLASTWLQAAEGILGPSPEETTTPAASLAHFSSQFKKTLEQLNKFGKRVVIWEPVPGARASVPEAMAREALSGKPSEPLEWTLSEYRQRYGFLFDALLDNQSLIAARISPSHALCQSGRCAVYINGYPIYSDNGHLARSSSRVLLAELLALPY
ncbi:MAG: acyltransferase [Burkholderiales bacterium]|nr:acyltransferase [Burkholderiales bacterium]